MKFVYTVLLTTGIAGQIAGLSLLYRGATCHYTNGPFLFGICVLSTFAVFAGIVVKIDTEIQQQKPNN